ncbi:MAG: helix-turn-helix domain-containing protein [Pseudonocardiaceae bacterium]|nr:helix-turn-helix domain-containing protein [Pseudonocardiaceae bacterium]
MARGGRVTAEWTETMYVEYGLTRDQSLIAARFQGATHTGFSKHHHPQHQLVLAARGSFTARVRDDAWVVQPGQAAWIPSDAEHDAIALNTVDLVCVYLEPEECAGIMTHASSRPAVFTPGGLMRELVLRLVQPDLDDEQACRLRAVLLDVLAVPGTTKTRLPVPTHPQARSVARALLAVPSDPRLLSVWSAELFVSARTLQRAFVTETGLSFAAWRALIRLDAAGTLLDQGEPVSAVAYRVGYGSVNGFTAAYRRHFGRSPGSRLSA